METNRIYRSIHLGIKRFVIVQILVSESFCLSSYRDLLMLNPKYGRSVTTVLYNIGNDILNMV